MVLVLLLNAKKKEKAEPSCKKNKNKTKAICRNMTKPIVTAAEKKANATRYCTSSRPQRNAALKVARKRDFNDLVKSCIKVGMSKPRAIEHATAAFNANAFANKPPHAERPHL